LKSGLDSIAFPQYKIVHHKIESGVENSLIALFLPESDIELPLVIAYLAI
jgi:hypothetical protein